MIRNDVTATLFPAFSNTRNVLDRFRQQAAALWPRSEVRGQTGSTGAAGEKIQGNTCAQTLGRKSVVNYRCDVSPSDPSQVNNMLDDTYPAKDFHSTIKPAIDELMGREVTFDILFHNSEHQATLLRYGVKKSVQVSDHHLLFLCVEFISDSRLNTIATFCLFVCLFVCLLQIERVYKHIMPAWKKLFEEKKL